MSAGSLKLLGACALALATSARADYEQGREAYREKDYASALTLLVDAEQRGDTHAADLLALMYESGRGVPKDPARALELIRRASEAGDADAMDNLAWQYIGGKDEAIAGTLAQRAAENWSLPAMTTLAKLYAEGKVLPRRRREAAALMQHAAAVEFAPALLGMASYVRDGIGMSPDIYKAEDWIRHAIDAGAEDAQSAVPGHQPTWFRPQPDRVAPRIFAKTIVDLIDGLLSHEWLGPIDGVERSHVCTDGKPCRAGGGGSVGGYSVWYRAMDAVPDRLGRLLATRRFAYGDGNATKEFEALTPQFQRLASAHNGYVVEIATHAAGEVAQESAGCETHFQPAKVVQVLGNRFRLIVSYSEGLSIRCGGGFDFRQNAYVSWQLLPGDRY